MVKELCMKKLWHPVSISLVIVTLISLLPFLFPDKTMPQWSDVQLRNAALSRNMLPVPKTYAALLKVVDNPDNPMSREKIALGQRLFFDNRLSRDQTLNCASCHILEEGGDDNRPTAIGFHGRENPFHLNSPTVLNAALQTSQFWNGSAADVEEQAGGPVQAPFEMNMTPAEVEKRLNADASLVTEFKRIFGGEKISFENVRKAIGVYERTLLTRGAYDRFLEGEDDAISTQAKRGMTLFISRGCKACHRDMALGGQSIEKFPLRRYFMDYVGVVLDPSMRVNDNPFPFENMGGFLGRDNRQLFKVPVLRNITQTAPYFHNGSIKEIEEVVRLMSKYQLGDEFSKEQIDDVVAFLKTLEGELVAY
jgi:cytochrome c peroxidase